MNPLVELVFTLCMILGILVIAACAFAGAIGVIAHVVGAFGVHDASPPEPLSTTALGLKEFLRRRGVFRRVALARGLATADDGSRVHGTIEGVAIDVRNGVTKRGTWFVEIDLTFPSDIPWSTLAEVQDLAEGPLVVLDARFEQRSIALTFDDESLTPILTLVSRLGQAVQEAEELALDDLDAASRELRTESPYRD